MQQALAAGPSTQLVEVVSGQPFAEPLRAGRTDGLGGPRPKFSHLEITETDPTAEPDPPDEVGRR